MTVYLDGYLDVPNDRLEEVLAALPQHITLTRAEPGCLKFEVLPCAQVPGRLIVAEQFDNQTAFDAHQQRTKASPWFEITSGIPRHYTIRTED